MHKPFVPRFLAASRLPVFLLALALPLAASAFGEEQGAPAAESLERALSTLGADEYRDELAWWAADEREGREPGSRGSLEAAENAAAEFARLGLRPAGDSVDGRPTYFQFLDQGGKPGLLEGSRLSAGERSFEQGKDWSLLAGSHAGTVRGAELVFAGYGIAAPEDGYDDYAGVDVSGKAVLILRYGPKDADGSPRWQGAAGAKRTRLRTKLEHAQKRGAAVVLLAGGTPAGSELDPLGDPSLVVSSGAKVPMVYVRSSVADALLEPAGRTLLELEDAIDKSGGPASFVVPGVRLDLEAKVGETVKARNVLGLLEGSDERLKEEIVVVGAHYDHIGRGAYGSLAADRIGEVHNGADDNASGSVGVIELAEALAESGLRPRRSILFELYDAEEKGFLGSRHFVEHPTVPLANIVAMINLDMIGCVADRGCGIFGTDTAKEWPEIVDRAIEGSPIPIRRVGHPSGGSDHVIFLGKGVPVLFFHSGMHKPYHTPDDDVERCHPESTVEILKAALKVLVEVANRDERLSFQKPEALAKMGRAFLGVRVEAAPEAEGVRVREVVPGSAAEDAGLERGDILLSVDDDRLKSEDDLVRAVRRRKPGDAVRLRYVRGDEGFEVAATLTSP
ncbi:MAG: M28 family peptidase [Planctomycetota bacterium]